MRGWALRSLICACARGCVGAISKLVKLECESQFTPLGMDARKPVLSWKLQDTTAGAKQTAYEIQVASSSGQLEAGKPDIWDSERVESGDSSAGLRRTCANGQQRLLLARSGVGARWQTVPAERCQLVETGLLSARKLKGQVDRPTKSPNLSTCENQVPVDYKFDTDAPKAADKAAHDSGSLSRRRGGATRILYVTGQDSAAAWINGKQVLEAEPLPPWNRCRGDVHDS